MHRVTVKTSTIFIAKGGRTRVYRSVSEIPQRLRKELEESTNGFNSATILIADRRGRKEIPRALQLSLRLRTRLFRWRLQIRQRPPSATRPLARFTGATGPSCRSAR
jgi:hypothetical protein